jgi:hypothetical protein
MSSGTIPELHHCDACIHLIRVVAAWASRRVRTSALYFEGYRRTEVVVKSVGIVVKKSLLNA